jgi:GAF domain-containing protein
MGNAGTGGQMVTPPDETTADPHAVITTLRQQLAERSAERDAALKALAERTTELAHRNSEYGERIGHQSATIDVLRAMSASPGNTQPIFDLIVRRATELCDADGGGSALLDGGMLRLQAYVNHPNPGAYEAAFPQPVSAATMFGRAILARDAVQMANSGMDVEYGLQQTLSGNARSMVGVPLLRAGTPIGALSVVRRQLGEFSAIQVELLKTFAEQAVIAITSAETYRALQERTTALAQRNSEYGERIAHQSATIDVLKVMSASPGNAQPVFDLICSQARTLLGCPSAGLFEYDGKLVHLRASSGASAVITDAAAFDAYKRRFPMVPVRGSLTCRAILDREMVHIRDLGAEPRISRVVLDLGYSTQVSIPLMRDGRAIGAITAAAVEVDGISDSQVALLRTFAEQAVIAITSAETYRALQSRTADLQQSLEYQTATSDVLKVISRSTFDLNPVLSTVAETAARLCVADQAAIFRLEGDLVRLAVNYGFPPQYKAYWDERGPVAMERPAVTATSRTFHERHPVHIHDVAAVTGYPDEITRLGKQRTSLGVPLLREGEPVGVILLARQKVEPFTDRQIELVSTFADQAVIAIENTRLITEQREALEQQTATTEVLEVINSSPGDLTPVFDAMLQKAMTLCEAGNGHIHTFDGQQFDCVAIQGDPEFVSWRRRRGPVQLGGGDDTSPLKRLMAGEGIVQISDVLEE